MISFVALLEGDFFSPNLWWDHSELSAHRNCCTSLCSLQIRSTGGISGFSLFFFFSPLCLTCRTTEKGQGWDISWLFHCALPCMVHRGGGGRGWKELWDKLGSCDMQLLRKQRVNRDWASKHSGWRRQGCQLFLHQPVEYLLLHMISVSV